MSGKEIYKSKSHPGRRSLYKEYSRLFPVQTAWKVALIVSSIGALIGLSFQFIYLFNDNKKIWMSFIFFFLYGVWAIIYCIYVFCVRDQAIALGGFQEFVIFDMHDNLMEYEANMFAAQISLPDDDILELIYQGFDVGQIARAMNSDTNLVALKVAALNNRAYHFREQEHNNKFLKLKCRPAV